MVSLLTFLITCSPAHPLAPTVNLKIHVRVDVCSFSAVSRVKRDRFEELRRNKTRARNATLSRNATDRGETDAELAAAATITRESPGEREQSSDNVDSSWTFNERSNRT